MREILYRRMACDRFMVIDIQPALIESKIKRIDKFRIGNIPEMFREVMKTVTVKNYTNKRKAVIGEYIDFLRDNNLLERKEIAAMQIVEEKNWAVSQSVIETVKDEEQKVSDIKDSFRLLFNRMNKGLLQLKAELLAKKAEMELTPLFRSNIYK